MAEQTEAQGAEAPQDPVVRGFDPDLMPGFHHGPFVKLVGLVWDELSPEGVRAHLDVDERHHQPYGIVHGGVYTTLVETLASTAAGINAFVNDGQLVVGVNNSTDFIRAHREGRLDAVAEPVHIGRTQQLWVVTISRASDGKTVARGQVRLQNLPTDRAIAGRSWSEAAPGPG